MKRNKWDGLRLNVALTAGVMATVMIALVMMQLDALQAERPQIGRLAIANVQATAVSSGALINLPFVAPPEAVAQVGPNVDPNAPVVPDSNPRTNGGEPDEAASFPVCGEVPAGWLLYTTVSGDTVALLAQATQSDPNAILAANCLSGDALTEGMQILLPSEPAAIQCGPPQSWVRYEVQVGDTMAALASIRNTTVAEVLLANCRDSEALSAGQMIFLPPGGNVVVRPVATAPSNVAPVVIPPPAAATATPVLAVTTAPTQAPPNPTSIPPVVPTNAPPPTVVIPPTVPVVPTAIRPTATPPNRVTATPPGVPPTPVPPTATSPAPTATNLPPTAVPPTATSPAPTATNPPPTATVPPRPTSTPVPPPTNTPPPPPTNTPVPPPPTNTPEPPPTNTPEPPPTDTPPPPDTPVPEPTTTPEPGPALAWYRLIVWERYWR